MRRGAFALVALFAVLPAVGCGTILSNQRVFGELSDYGLGVREQRVYGGVRSDGEMIGKAWVKWASGDTDMGGSLWHQSPEDRYRLPNVLFVPYVTLYLLVDMPLSLVADTIMLPWDIRAQWRRLTGKTPLVEQLKDVKTEPAAVEKQADGQG